MANNNKRTVAGGPTQNGPVKGPTAAASPVANSNGAKNYIEREKKLLELLSEHVKDNTGKQAYEQMQHELQQMTQEVQDLKTQLETLRNQHEGQLSKVRDELANQKTLVQNLHASHENRLRELGAKSQRDDAELAALSVTTQTLQEARETLNTLNQRKDHLEGECFQLKQRLDKASDSIQESRRKCGMQQLQIDQLNDDLNRSRKTSRDLNEEMGGLPFDKDAIEEEFEKLATKFHDLVLWAFCDRNLRFPDNHNPNFTSASSQVVSGIPQLASNSMPARYMRCALAEAVISDVLSRLVFSNRILATARLKGNGGDNSADLGPMVAGLETLSSRGYPVEATIIQWQLVKVCQQLKSSRKTVSRATQAVCHILDPWLVVECRESSTKDEFADQLTSLFSEAAGLWQTLQRTRANATAAVGNAGGDWDYEEDSWPEYNMCEKPPSTPTAGKDGSPVDDHDTRRRWSSLTNGHPTSLPVASLFPRILAGNKLSDEHDDDNIIFRGYALLPMQRVLLAAREEFAAQQEQQMRSTPPPMTRRDSGFSRRRVSRAERPAAPAPAPLSRDDQKVRDRGGPSHQKQAESQLPPVGGGSTKSNVSSRRLSVSSRDGGSHAPPLQQRSAVSESERGSSTVSSHRSRR
ncbi:hypothetical protein QBC37DRAFT_27355 [Rhypophila decipiens]|uniref:Uncharacterized protein n=1 Tax=Rhypophila decipiens TaxID=261697 RepID=A0AAN7B5I0_9PEZI|nr:hypothetical protein QBC37DRAFT_27355 [Rhypophila decipiens]